MCNLIEEMINYYPVATENKNNLKSFFNELISNFNSHKKEVEFQLSMFRI